MARDWVVIGYAKSCFIRFIHVCLHFTIHMCTGKLSVVRLEALNVLKGFESI